MPCQIIIFIDKCTLDLNICVINTVCVRVFVKAAVYPWFWLLFCFAFMYSTVTVLTKLLAYIYLLCQYEICFAFLCSQNELKCGEWACFGALTGGSYFDGV